MSTGRSENEKHFSTVSYLRLLSYVKPYRAKMIIGILAGFIVGGSLFGSLLILPDMLMVVDQDSGQSKKVEVQAAQIVSGMEKAPAGLTSKEKAELVRDILHPKDNDPKLTEALNKIRKYTDQFHLPLIVEKHSVTVTWPYRFEFPIVDNIGRMTWQFFSLYAVMFVLLWGLKNIATYVNHYYTRWVGARVIRDLRDQAYKHLMNQSLSYYGRQDIGHLISRCTTDIAAIENSVSVAIADATRCPIEILACAAAVVISCVHQKTFGLLIILGLGMPVCILPIVIIARIIRKIYRKSFSNIAEVVSRMHETFSGIQVVKANHMEEREINTFQQVNRTYFKNIIKALRIQLLMSPLMESVSVLAALAFLVFAYSKGVTVSQMVILLAPAILAYRPIKDLSKVVSHLQKSMAAADRYFDLIDNDASLPEKIPGVELTMFKDSIEFKNVEFAYEENRPILRGIDLKIKRGTMIAVVGETGSGKTTIANLITRFYDATSGTVCIDGVPIQDYSIASLRKNIGIVTQDPILFNDTIANNISYGMPNATMDEIVLAAKEANAHQFITGGGHPGEYQEEVGEKGFKLSGGEKQRIAIARAILKNPPILILDEATSALDTVTEKLVQEALTKVMTNRTVFAIAHRLSTIRNADQILVLNKGKIVEQGTHEELLALGGRYKRLHDTQFSMDHD